MNLYKLKDTGINDIIWQKICNIFFNHPNITEVILFGSRAMGNYKPSSDVDLCIIGENIDFSELALLEDQIEDLLLPWKFDLILLSSIDNQKLLEHIKYYGKKIYNVTNT